MVLSLRSDRCIGLFTQKRIQLHFRDGRFSAGIVGDAEPLCIDMLPAVRESGDGLLKVHGALLERMYAFPAGGATCFGRLWRRSSTVAIRWCGCRSSLTRWRQRLGDERLVALLRKPFSGPPLFPDKILPPPIPSAP